MHHHNIWLTHLLSFPYRQLADFVGSRKTLRELCCMSVHTLEDLGQSVNGFQRDQQKKRMRLLDGRRGRHRDSSTQNATDIQRRKLQEQPLHHPDDHRNDVNVRPRRRRLLRKDRGELFRNHNQNRGPGRRFQPEKPEQVKARYGKWVQRLQDQPELSRQLHEIGKASLEAFGYEPPTPFMDPPMKEYLEQCDAILEAGLCSEPPSLKNKQKASQG